MVVKHLRMDNAGENKLLAQRADSDAWKLHLNIEWTARATPQQNSLAEVGFATIASRGRALMIAANVPVSERCRLWSEAFQAATLLDGLIPHTADGETKTKFQHWCGRNPPFAKHLRNWGEAGTQ